jgi:protoporphyrinogen oxidase
VAAKSPFPDQWIYVHSPHIRTGRITNFGNWVPTLAQGQNDTILCLEYWCNDDDPMWSDTTPDLVRLASDEIYQTGLVPEGKVTDGHVVRIPRCYPVYSKGYRSHLKPVEAFLSQQKGITAIGRYGAFKYNNQDHSILMGLLAAENIADGASHDLWSLNTDYEYQESCRITATGLVRT